MAKVSGTPWRLLRTIADISQDDDDWAGDDPQTLPDQHVQVLVPSGPALRSVTPLKMAVKLEWLDANGDVVGRSTGTFDIQGIIVRQRTRSEVGTVGDSSIVADAEVSVSDTAALTGKIAYRPVIFDELMPGDRFTVRLTNMDHPTATRARVLCAELF